MRYSNKIVTDLIKYLRGLKLEISKVTPKALLKTAPSLLEVSSKSRLQTPQIRGQLSKRTQKKMCQVFVNIIKNVIDAMQEGRTSTVKSRAVNGRLEITFKDA